MEVKLLENVKSGVVPQLHAAISETQLAKDAISTELVRLRRRKQRLAEDVVKLVVESNTLYLRTEKNIRYKKPLMMHERDLLAQTPMLQGSTLATSQGLPASAGPTITYQD